MAAAGKDMPMHRAVRVLDRLFMGRIAARLTWGSKLPAGFADHIVTSGRYGLFSAALSAEGRACWGFTIVGMKAAKLESIDAIPR